MKHFLTLSVLAIVGLATFTGCTINDGGSTIKPTVATTATITTNTINNITALTAGSGGDISNDGGAPVTAKGVCWSTSTGPTVALPTYYVLPTTTIDGTGTGSFTSSITGLVGLTTYYVRAYATNSVGTAYGNEVTFTTPFGIGASFGGGKVAYILQPGDPGYDPLVQHGLIAAGTDQSTGIPWRCCCDGTFITTDTALGTGQANTDLIVKDFGEGTAAKLCDDLVLNGYSDWYLPSNSELNKLYTYKLEIGGFRIGDAYWSSSANISFADYKHIKVYCYSFCIVCYNDFLGHSFDPDFFQAYTCDDRSYYRVRAVRSF